MGSYHNMAHMTALTTAHSLAHHILRKFLACILHNFDIALADEGVGKIAFPRYLDVFPRRWSVDYMRLRLTPRNC